MTLEKFERHVMSLSQQAYLRWWFCYRLNPWTMAFRMILPNGTDCLIENERDFLRQGYYKEDRGKQGVYWTIERTFEDGSRYIPRGFADNG